MPSNSRLFFFLVTSTTAALLLVQRQPGAGEQKFAAGSIVVAGVALLLFDGKGRVTPLGLFGYATALFLGYGGWAITTIDGSTKGVYAGLVATLACLGLTQLVGTPRAQKNGPASLDESTSALFIAFGALALLALYPLRGIAASEVVDGSAFAAVVVAATGTIFNRHGLKFTSCVITLSMLVAYAEIFHGGSGRLRLVGLACTVVFLFTLRYPGYRYKLGLIGFTPVAVWWLARSRVALQNSLSPGGGSGNTGLESLYTAPRAFGQLIEAHMAQGFPLHYGSSFFTPFFVVVPKQFRPAWVPESFGYDLVQVTRPDLYDSGYSTSGTAFGEWYWNFGLAGLLVGPIAIGLMLRLIDRLIQRAMDGSTPSVQRVTVGVFFLMVGATVGDLAWGGFHNWIVRDLLRAPLIFVLLMIVQARFLLYDSPPHSTRRRRAPGGVVNGK